MTRRTASSSCCRTSGVSCVNPLEVPDGEGGSVAVAVVGTDTGAPKADPPATGTRNAPTTTAVTAPRRNLLHECLMGRLPTDEDDPRVRARRRRGRSAVRRGTTTD